MFGFLKSKKVAVKDKAEQKIFDDVDSYGWSVMNVFDEHGKEPNFSYSIGMYKTLGSPEFVIFGMEGDESKNIINTIGQKIKRGDSIQTSTVYTDILEDNWPCVFIEVKKDNYQEHFGFDFWFYKNWNFPVFQCVWSDDNGNYPWNTEFNPKVKHLQVLLGESK